MQSIVNTATMWGVSPSTVRLWIKLGLLDTVRLGAHAIMVTTTVKPVRASRGRPKRKPAE